MINNLNEVLIYALCKLQLMILKKKKKHGWNKYISLETNAIKI